MDDREAAEFYEDPAHREAAGPGRKRKGQRRSVMFSVRFAPEAIEALVDTALAEGLTVSAWIRRLVDREIAERSAGRTFSCPHFSIGNVSHAECAQCGPLP